MKESLATAYVQIIPTTDGIKGTLTDLLDDEAGKAGDKAGGTAGGAFVSKIKSAIAAAGIGVAIKDSLLKGADLQQSLGGIETLFKESGNIVVENAKNAYATAGLSANAYMESVTGFSASLLQSLGGDTEKAANVAHMALTDMSDNANKMGSTMESIQYAYQGFAKQNYTMLDNLKLGYGGSATEMARLVNESGVLGDKIIDLTDKQNIGAALAEVGLAKIYEAIHVVQENLDITGTTSEEAAKTFSGSFAAMRAAVDNALGNLSLGEAIDYDALIQTTSAFVFDNFLPMMGNIITTLPDVAVKIGTYFPVFVEKGKELLGNFVKGIVDSIPERLPQALDFLQQLGNKIAEKMPVFIEKGFQLLSELVSGIVSAIPILIAKVPTIVSTFANIINDNFPTILAKGVQILMQLISGIISAVPTLVANIPKIISAIVDTLMAFNWLNLGKNILTFFKNGIQNMVPAVKNAASNISSGIRDTLANLPSNLMNLGKSMMHDLGGAIGGLKSYVTTNVLKIASGIESTLLTLPTKVVSIGKDIISGIWKGLSDNWKWLLGKVKDLAESIFDSACEALGIHSPSTKFQWIAEMTGEGYEKGSRKQTPKLIRTVKMQQDSIVKSAEESSKWGTVPVSDNATERIIRVIVPVQLDGREIARSTAEFTNEQMVWEVL